ncbi:MAG: GerMN domain-containing protein [Clostridia bacterium]|nr:GerMN domain-containing protein [Clostridia bacterium]
MNRKVFLTIMAILIIGIVGVTIYLLTNKNNDVSQNEIQPQEEVGNDTMRQTIATLYYQNKETKELMPEGRMIDSKTLLTDPYATLITLLIEGPKNEKLQTVIPEGTRVLKAELKGDIVYLDLSKEFIDNHKGGQEAENMTVYAIVNTLTQLNEVSSVKILINGRENQAFKDNKINFKNAFIRIEKNSNTTKQTNTNQVTNNTQTNKTNNTTNSTQNNKVANTTT